MKKGNEKEGSKEKKKKKILEKTGKAIGIVSLGLFLNGVGNVPFTTAQNVEDIMDDLQLEAIDESSRDIRTETLSEFSSDVVKDEAAVASGALTMIS